MYIENKLIFCLYILKLCLSAKESANSNESPFYFNE